MNLTPDNSKVLISNKTSLSGTGSISKSLLTPCRQVGLSRKRKTPSSLFKYAPLIENSTKVENVEINTTPVNHRKSLKRRKKDDLDNSPVVIQEAALKDDRFLGFASEDFSKSKELLGIEESKVNVQETTRKGKSRKVERHLEFNSEDIPKLKPQQPKQGKYVENEPNVQEIKVDSHPDDTSELKTMPKKVDVENKLSIKKPIEIIKQSNRVEPAMLPQDKESSEFNFSRLLENKSMSLNQELQSQTTENINPPLMYKKQFSDSAILTKKRIKRVLSLKKSVDLSDNATETKKINTTNIKPCLVKLQKLPENCSPAATKAVIDHENVQENHEKLLREIFKLENQTSVKTEKLAKLKQAYIYKNKHNLEELQELTGKYRKACIEALGELLNNLRVNGPMEMSTLIKDLNVPASVADKLKQYI